MGYTTNPVIALSNFQKMFSRVLLRDLEKFKIRRYKKSNFQSIQVEWESNLLRGFSFL